MNKFVSALTAFTLISSPLAADQTYCMNIDVPPFTNDRADSYQQGIDTLQILCDKTTDKNIASLCREAADIAYEVLYDYRCIDPNNLPHKLNPCQAEGVSRYIVELHDVFAKHLNDNKRSCFSTEKDVFEIQGNLFTFKCLPA